MSETPVAKSGGTWQPMHAVVVSALVAIIAVQWYMLSARAPSQPTAKPPIAANTSVPGKGPAPPPNGNPVPQNGSPVPQSAAPGPRASASGGTYKATFVVARVLLHALVVMQDDPKTALSADQRAKVAPMLQKWQEVSKQRPLVMRRLWAVIETFSSEQKTALRRHIDESGPNEKLAQPEWDQVLQILQKRAGNAAAKTDAGDAANKRAQRLPAAVILSGLLKLEANATTALKPEQAAALLPVLSDWQKETKEISALQDQIMAVLEPQQRKVVDDVASTQGENMNSTSVKEALAALDGQPHP